MELLSQFSFINITSRYLDQVHRLLEEHYIQDCNGIITSVSKDYVYWFIKRTRSEHFIGLLYRKILVGCIGAVIIESEIDSTVTNIAYINLWCLQHKLRGRGLGKGLFDQILSVLRRDGIDHVIYQFPKSVSNSETIPHTIPFILSTQTFAIPINYPKLSHIGFLPVPEAIQPPRLLFNPLHLMLPSDIPSLQLLLKHSKTELIGPSWGRDSILKYLLPYKRIVYTFVIRQNNHISDCVSVSITNSYDEDRNWNVVNAQLNLVCCTRFDTDNLTTLINYLLDKLSGYDIDQLIIDSRYESYINLTKYTYSENHYKFEHYGETNTNFNSNNLVFCIPL